MTMFFLLTVCSVSAQISRQRNGRAGGNLPTAAYGTCFLCRYFEAGLEKHYPYVGWGHKLFMNEVFGTNHDKTGCG